MHGSHLLAVPNHNGVVALRGALDENRDGFAQVALICVVCLLCHQISQAIETVLNDFVRGVVDNLCCRGAGAR